MEKAIHSQKFIKDYDVGEYEQKEMLSQRLIPKICSSRVFQRRGTGNKAKD